MNKLLLGLATIFLFACSKNSNDSQTPTPPAQLKVDKSSLKLSGDKNSVDSFTIQYSGNWKISFNPSTVSWLKTTPLSGSANALIRVTAEEDNFTSADRTATIIVTPDGDVSKAVNVGITQQPGSNTLDSGLIAYYPFDGNANDSSGNKSNLTLQGATPTDDRFGSANKAYHFDDSNSIMQVPQFTAADSIATFSVSVWIKTAKEGYIYALSVEPYSPQHQAMYVYKDSVTGQFTITCYITEVYPTGGSITSVLQNTIPDISNVWTHLVLVQDGNGIYLYVNGVKASNTNLSPLTAYFAGGGLIGALYDYQTVGHYGGDLDDLRFYKRALSETEIKRLHDQ
jgi:hypothetical protein